MHRLRPRLSYANVVSTLCLFIVLGGGAWAASAYVGSDGQIKGCVGSKGKLALVKPGKSCGNGQSGISWNQRGMRGPRGLAGAPATKLWAKVNGDATLAHGSGVVSVHRCGTNTGCYIVSFNRSVINCARVASPLDPGFFINVGNASGGEGKPPLSDGVTVQTPSATNPSGPAPDERFDLAVFC